ncbi:MAG: TMEM165/GDT1 family protein [Streptosporangiaceae bacterium]
MNLPVALATFALVFPAELPDKTAVASLVLGSRYRPRYVYLGVAVGFAASVMIALAAGSLLALLPHRVLAFVVAVLFAAGAVLLLRTRHEPGEQSAPDSGSPVTMWRVALTSFLVIVVAEMGDLTQILIVNLAARYHDPLAVGLGGLAALWAVAALAIVGGRGLLRIIPVRLITLVGAGAMAVLAVLSLISAVTG